MLNGSFNFVWLRKDFHIENEFTKAKEEEEEEEEEAVHKLLYCV